MLKKKVIDPIVESAKDLAEFDKRVAVPSFANKERVIRALDDLKIKYSELSEFIFDLQKFIDERVK